MYRSWSWLFSVYKRCLENRGERQESGVTQIGGVRCHSRFKGPTSNMTRWKLSAPMLLRQHATKSTPSPYLHIQLSCSRNLRLCLEQFSWSVKQVMIEICERNFHMAKPLRNSCLPDHLPSKPCSILALLFLLNDLDMRHSLRICFVRVSMLLYKLDH